MTGMKYSLVALLLLSFTTTAIAKRPVHAFKEKQLEANQRYVVLPGTRLVAGNAEKNEFYILGGAKSAATPASHPISTQTKQAQVNHIKRDKIAMIVKRAMIYGKASDLRSAHMIKKTVVKKAKPHRLAQKNKTSIKLKKIHATKNVKVSQYAKKIMVASIKKKHNVPSHG